MRLLFTLFVLFASGISQAQTQKCLSGDCKNGFGKFDFGNGAIYEGNFKNGVFHGEGTVSFSDDNTTYSGNWVDHKLTYGTITRQSPKAGKYTYTGDIDDYNEHGKGKGEWVEIKLTYEGDWVSGDRHGFGKETSEMLGQTYEGNWKLDEKSGYGKLNSTLLFVYEYNGNFEDGEQNGHGTCVYKNGTKYVGNWSNGKRNGQGEQTWKSGWKFVGEFKENMPYNGTLSDGTYIINEGIIDWKTNKNSFFDGELLGAAAYRRSLHPQDSIIDILWENGSYYVGHHHNQYGVTWSPNGIGIKVLSDGTGYYGNFTNGTLKDTLQYFYFNPSLPNYIASQGYAMAAMDCHDYAFKQYKNARKISGENAYILDLEGQTYLALGDTLNATLSYEKALKIDASQPTVLQDLANIYYHTGKYKLSIDRAEKLASIEPENINAWWYIGLSSMELAKFDRGIQAIEKVLTTYPDPDGNVHYYLGICYEGKGEKEKACIAFATSFKRGWSDSWNKLNGCN